MSSHISELVSKLMATDTSCQALGYEATERLVKTVAGMTYDLPDDYLLPTASAASLVGVNLIDFFMFCENHGIVPIEMNPGSEYYFAGDILRARAKLYNDRNKNASTDSNTNQS